jgi:hypothetical protein
MITRRRLLTSAGLALAIRPALAAAVRTRAVPATQDVNAIIAAALATLPQQTMGRGGYTNYAGDPGGGWMSAAMRANIDYACDLVGTGATIWGGVNVWLDAVGALCAAFIVTTVFHDLYVGFQSYANSAGNRYVNWMWTNVYPHP